MPIVVFGPRFLKCGTMKQNEKLRAYWSKKQDDLMLSSPIGNGTKSDAHYLANILNREVTDELDERGYDLTTLKFSIEPKKNNKKFVSQRT